MIIMSKRIVFQGDSITDAGRCYDQDVPPNEGLGQGYPVYVAASLLAYEPEKNYEFFNRGISGNRIVDLYARWKQDMINLKPDVLSIMIGVNDTWHEKATQNGVEVPRYKQFYSMLLDWTLQELPNIKILLMEPYVLPFGAADESWIEEIDQRRAVVKEMSEKYNTLFLPVQSILNEACKRAPMDYWLCDGVHPKIAGHQLIADAWIKATTDIR